MEKEVKCKSCPECGYTKYLNENLVGDGYRVCKRCKQEWWTDVDYPSHINKKFMTPKEQAEELFNKHYQTIFEYGEDYSEEILISILSIKASIIGVDSIIEVMEDLDKHTETIYWKKVKKELEKM